LKDQQVRDYLLCVFVKPYQDARTFLSRAREVLTLRNYAPAAAERRNADAGVRLLDVDAVAAGAADHTPVDMQETVEIFLFLVFWCCLL
jgi:hypothetical protein